MKGQPKQPPNGRRHMARVDVYMDREEKRRLKVLAAQLGTTVQAIAAQAILEALRRLEAKASI